MADKDTLVVNLWAGPGTGKSTNAALVFGKLKVAGISAELVHEFAKDLVWEGRSVALANQAYIMAKQQHHIERVQGQVEVIVTDSPLLLGRIYKGKSYTDGLGLHLIETVDRWRTLNIFLERDIEHHPYVQSGRHQSLKEAMAIDRQILDLLEELQLKYYTVSILAGEGTADSIVEIIKRKLADQDPWP